MMLNETRNVLWHESCKCVCRSNSSVYNSKQIWNSDPWRCDYNEDFAGIINCTKGYTWNPSTCECQCDMWCKPCQYLDYKKCVCKNKLIGRVISDCTSLINETMISNKKNISNDDTITNIFIGLFSVLLFTGIVCLYVFTYFKLILNILIIKKSSSNYKMIMESLKIKTKSNYNWDDIVYIYDIDVKLTKVIKRESRIGVDNYYIEYVFDSEYETHSIKPLYLVVNHLFGHIKK